jgi:hypothetical protein
MFLLGFDVTKNPSILEGLIIVMGGGKINSLPWESNSP